VPFFEDARKSSSTLQKSGVADACIKCRRRIKKTKAIEWGHVFKQDLFYTEPHKGYFVDRDGKEKPMWMGAYGIGVGRSMATIVETHNDERGIVWPKSVAPYDVHLLDLSQKSKVKSQKLYEQLQAANIDVLYDDREIGAGEKFADADLIGCPVRLVVSEKTLRQAQGMQAEKVEYKHRDSDKTELLTIDELLKKLYK
jgi:prolyl-tRNA synthetase